MCEKKVVPVSGFLSASIFGRDRRSAWLAIFCNLPKADWLLADWGHDADWLRDALKDKGIRLCIPGRKSRKKTVKYDKRRYKRRNLIEIMFGRLKDAEGRNPIRQMLRNLALRHRHRPRRNGAVLAMKLNES